MIKLVYIILRLDFDNFVIANPSTTGLGTGTDAFSITSPTAVNPPTICGINSGQHSEFTSWKLIKIHFWNNFTFQSHWYLQFFHLEFRLYLLFTFYLCTKLGLAICSFEFVFKAIWNLALANKEGQLKSGPIWIQPQNVCHCLVFLCKFLFRSVLWDWQTNQCRECHIHHCRFGNPSDKNLEGNTS